MKSLFYFKSLIMGLVSAFFISSCTIDDQEFALDNTNDLQLQITEKSSTRSMEEDTLSPMEYVILEETEELKELASLFQKRKLRKAKALSSSYEYDDFFSSNMYAIRELPLTIKVRAVADGSSALNSYFYCEGKNKEITLSSSSTNIRTKFYIKVLPATTGIPYMIYSKYTNTPLAVGQEKKNPENKVLFATNDDPTSTFALGWDFLPATYKGYFAIQSESYLGQTDPNNMWSIFYYVLEAKAKNKIGFAQRVANKAQQEFLITLDNTFGIEDVAFDLENATISSAPDIIVVKSTTNSTDFKQKRVIISNVNATETSTFTETTSYLKLGLISWSQFVRPVPVAGKAIIPENQIADASYSTTPQNYPVTRADTTSIEMKPNSLLQLTVRFKTFNLSVPYVVTARYGTDRIVKIRGIWRGYAIANPQYNKPIYEPHFYDLESGEELSY